MLVVGAAAALAMVGAGILLEKCRKKEGGRGQANGVEVVAARFLWLTSLCMIVAYGALFANMLSAAAAVVPAGYTGPWTFIRPDIITKVPFWRHGNPEQVVYYACGIAFVSFLVRPSRPAAVVGCLAIIAAEVCNFLEGWYFDVD